MKDLVIFVLCFGVIQASTKTVELLQQIPEANSRIIGGENAQAIHFPWHVLISTTMNDGSTARSGGAILSNVWVVTAAHSVEKAVNFYLRFGSASSTGTALAEAHVYSAIIHPNYIPRTLQNNIALLRLPSPIPYGANIQPIQLPALSQSTTSFAEVIAVISGFGITSDSSSGMAVNLVSTNVTVIENVVCQSVYGAAVVTSQVICTRGTKSISHSFCKGDDGGPLVFRAPNGTPTLIGIMSFTSDRGCSSGDPAGYTRMTQYVNWINSVTGISTIP